MESLKTIDTKNLHHAYLLEDDEGIFIGLQELLKGSHKDAEVHVREFETLGIDDSRALIHMAGMRSLGTQLFIYRAQSCTREAQNALLKLFEEPPERTHFFICLTGIQNVLPTLRSRVWVVNSTTATKESTSGKEFLHASAGARLELLEPILKEKSVSEAGELLKNIEAELYSTKNTKNTEITALALQHIIDVRKVLQDKGASLKTLMERVALVVPKN